MSMNIGVQLCAPNGFETLAEGRMYHFLVNDGCRGRVLLVEFVQRPLKATKNAKHRKRVTPTPLTVLHSIRRERFEQALVDGEICRMEPQLALPPWLGGLTSTQLAAHDANRRKAQKTHKERIDTIIGYLQPLLDRLGEVFAADDPFAEINRQAKACDTKQNATRLRFWFLTYLCYGRNRWALHYPIHNIGHWDRFEKVGKKFGSPSKAGRNHGYGSNDHEMIKKIEDGYRKFAKRGVDLAEIFRKTLRKQFGCKWRRDGHGNRQFYHPDGVPFPSWDEYIYRLNQLVSVEERQITKHGFAWRRNKRSAPKGTFHESVGCLMERVEGDAYVVEEVAEGFLPGSHLPSLVTARTKCTTSGMMVGIGFSVGGERAAAYRMAKFCMAIDKVKFCQLFGHTIAPEDWPCIGLPSNDIFDRGAGITPAARAQGMVENEGEPVISEGTPSYAAQSKAVIESSNPRTVPQGGAPTFITTKMTIPQLAWREITRTIRTNHTSNVETRLNNEAIIEGVGHTPIDLWNFLDERARSCAVPMPFEDAVLAYGTPIVVKAVPLGVMLKGQLYDSPALRETGLHERVAVGQHVLLKGYMFDVCVRHFWVEVGGELIEVDAMLAISAGENQLYLSVNEVEQVDKLRRQGRREFNLNKQVELSYWEEKFFEETGLEFDQGTRHQGRNKRNSVTSRRERREISDYLDGRTSKQ
ncbi:MAG: hypothetical protein AB2598_21130 [Candidatus Thiodiazotropha sp.]